MVYLGHLVESELYNISNEGCNQQMHVRDEFSNYACKLCMSISCMLFEVEEITLVVRYSCIAVLEKAHLT